MYLVRLGLIARQWMLARHIRMLAKEEVARYRPKTES